MRAYTGGVYPQAWYHVRRREGVSRVATTPAVRRVASASFARLRVLGEGTAELVHEAWDDAIWRTRSPQRAAGRQGWARTRGCRRGCRAGNGARVGADCTTTGPLRTTLPNVGGWVARAGKLTKVDPIVEPSPTEIDEVGGGPRHAVHVNFGLDRSHGRLEGRARVGLPPVRIRVGMIIPQPAATDTH